MSKIASWQAANGWRELFARIFAGMTPQVNVLPEWLVNPATNRRLKLDLLYPEINVAVRFEGVRQRGQRVRRLSLEEEVQVQLREDARVTVCRQHGIELVVVDVTDGRIGRVFRQIDTALSRAARRTSSAALRQQISQARQTASELSARVKSLSDLRLYADLWADREYRLTTPEPSPELPPAPAVEFSPGMAVEHTLFGAGVVVQTTPANGDTLITVDFADAGQKTLAASLVGGKLFPKNSG
ncbi:MAG: hypothetical protein D6768_09495 [Chloroflexi bacterium]|nr:MAG: hypothetical protein D6768_09495 [Chloroflexota bacterium]